MHVAGMERIGRCVSKAIRARRRSALAELSLVLTVFSGADRVWVVPSRHVIIILARWV
jgi:hypothetical protein